MRKLFTASAALLLLSGCNTIDGFGKDLGSIGQGFGNLFDSSIQTSRAKRDSNTGGYMSPPPMRAPQQQSPYPPQQNGYGQMGGNGGYGGGYGGGQNMGAMPPQFPPYYQQQPRQPAMPYYYNEGY